MKSLLILLFCGISVIRIIPQVSGNYWITYFEKSGFISTPDYEQTISYFQRLADYSEFAELFSFGVSPQGRELKYLLATKESKKSPGMNEPISSTRFSKPTVLIINGIHSGEIEGKDASMILMREILITKEKENLLDSLNIIVVPVFNVDGHERKSKYNRINQNGPEEMGWRTTAQNLNLNRDWMKADAPEMQAMLKLVNDLDPDFIIDTHTTDGADYQYTVTYSVEWSKNMFKQTADWLGEKFVPYLEHSVTEKGFLIFPYVYLKDWNKGLDEGLIYWPATPRFSTGYFALRNRPSLLVETHMIKPYKDRVYSTEAVLETTLEFLFNNSSELKRLNKEADKQTTKLCEMDYYLPVAFSNSENYELKQFKGYEYYLDSSAVSGSHKLVYTNEKKDFEIKYYNDVIVTDSVKVAKGYFIPPEYSFIADKLKLHGINPSSVLKEKTTVPVIRYRFKDVKFSESSFEGRHTVNFDYDTFTEEVRIPAGTYLYYTNNRTAGVLTLLLEPESADSFIRWGFMNQIFEQKEYYEDYVMEKIAEEMLANDPALKTDFEHKLMNDEIFRNSPHERLNYFFELSPYKDKLVNVYPVMRID